MSLRKSSIAVVAIGVLLVLTVGCPTTTTPNTTTGNAADGQAKFNSTCAGCHTASTLAGVRDMITNNMGTINAAMSGITLTNQQVADLQAFLATQ